MGAVVNIVAMLKLSPLAIGGALYVKIMFIDYNILQQPAKEDFEIPSQIVPMISVVNLVELIPIMSVVAQNVDCCGFATVLYA